MPSIERLIGCLAALMGGLGIAAGAYAAHGLANAADAGRANLLGTAAQYAVWHALATLVALARPGGAGGRLAAALFTGGALLFSGSLAAIVFGAPRSIGVVTPWGGGLMLAGWLALAVAMLNERALPSRALPPGT